MLLSHTFKASMHKFSRYTNSTVKARPAWDALTLKLTDRAGARSRPEQEVPDPHPTFCSRPALAAPRGGPNTSGWFWKVPRFPTVSRILAGIAVSSFFFPPWRVSLVQRAGGGSLSGPAARAGPETMGRGGSRSRRSLEKSLGGDIGLPLESIHTLYRHLFIYQYSFSLCLSLSLYLSTSIMLSQAIKYRTVSLNTQINDNIE